MNALARAAMLAAALASGLAASRAAAIELRKDPNSGTVFLSGDIQVGDEAKFAQFVNAARPDIESIALESFGGDVMVAVEIGRMIKRLGLTTAVLPGRQCNSACFFIWAGGAIRHSRLGILGIHRPFAAYTGPDQPQSAEQLAGSLYAAAETYLGEMGIPRRIIDKLLSTPPSELHVLTDAELRTIPADQRQ